MKKTDAGIRFLREGGYALAYLMIFRIEADHGDVVDATLAYQLYEADAVNGFADRKAGFRFIAKIPGGLHLDEIAVGIVKLHGYLLGTTEG